MGSMRALRQVPPQMDELLPDQLDTLLDSGDFPLTADTTCGYWIFRGKLCQRLVSFYIGFAIKFGGKVL